MVDPRGRAARPTALKVLEGTRRDRINFNEPKAQPGAPVCPPGTAPDVRDVWDYTVKQLTTMRVLSKADRDALLTYCEAVVVHRRASEAIHEQGVTVVGHLGTPIKNPAVNTARDAGNQIRAFAREFGLTPSARSGIRINEAGDAPVAARLLS